MHETRTDFLNELASALRGPRRARARLLLEIDEHFEDALEAARTEGLDRDAAESAVLARLGTVDLIATNWNEGHQERRGVRQRNVAMFVLAAVVAVMLGLTQYAAGKDTPAAPAVCGAAVVPRQTSHAINNCQPPSDRFPRSVRPRPAP
jgi:hypothetical protein